MNVHVDWAEHYKQVRRRISNAGVMAVEIPPLVVDDPVVLPPFPAITFPKGVNRYPVPIGPSKPRDWLLIASVSKDLSIRRAAPRIHMKRILEIVAGVYNAPIECLKSSRRTASVVRPRQEAMWLCKKYTLHSLPEIGRFFGGRDHTTVLHAVRKIDQLVRESGYACEAEPVIKDYILYLFREDAAPMKELANV